MGWIPKTRNLFMKNCVFILTCLNFSHLQSTLHLMQDTCQDIFSTAQNSFWTCWFWRLLVLLPLFVSPLPHWQNVSLWGLFSSVGKRKVAWGKIRWIVRVGHRGPAVFGQKLQNTQCSVCRCTCKSPIMKRTNALSLQKNSLKLNTASHNNASWCTNTDGFLQHSPSQGSLYYKESTL